MKKIAILALTLTLSFGILALAGCGGPAPEEPKVSATNEDGTPKAKPGDQGGSSTAEPMKPSID